jgi:dihydrolipoamide dehydrogenase
MRCPERAVILGGWRHRCRVRERVEVLRRRRDDRRGRSPARAAEDEACLRRAWSGRSASARSLSRPAAPFSVTQDDRAVRVTLESGEQIEADLAARRGGPWPVTLPVSVREPGSRWSAAYVLTNERCTPSVPGVYAVGDIVPGLQLAHRGFAQGIFVAEHIAGLDPDADRRERHPARHLLRPRDRLGGSDRGRKPRSSTARTRSRPYEYNLGGNGKSQILGTSGFVKVVRREDGPSWGSTWSVPAWASRSARRC